MKSSTFGLGLTAGSYSEHPHNTGDTADKRSSIYAKIWVACVQLLAAAPSPQTSIPKSPPGCLTSTKFPKQGNRKVSI